jgi:hypothetical protein
MLHRIGRGSPPASQREQKGERQQGVVAGDIGSHAIKPILRDRGTDPGAADDQAGLQFRAK